MPILSELSKMCRRVPLEKKIQPARGFPQEGWYFAFEGSARSEYQGLVLISPSSRKYFTVEAAKNHHKTALADLDPQVFYNYVGLEVTTATESSRSYHSHAVKGGKTTAQSKNRNNSSSQEDPGVLANHALIGKDFNQRWTTLDGQTKVIYGTVEACHDIGGDLYFSIRYKEASRDLVNTGQNVSGGYVPEVQQLPETITFGGCLEIDSSIDNTKSVDSPLRWIVPDMRYVDFEVANGERVPRLRMYVRGFELIFKVKQSEVAPNSGKGVFVSCRSMTGAPSLELKSGELIDIGGKSRLMGFTLVFVISSNFLLFRHVFLLVYCSLCAAPSPRQEERIHFSNQEFHPFIQVRRVAFWDEGWQWSLYVRYHR